MFLIVLAGLYFNDSNLVLFFNDEIQLLFAILVVIMKRVAIGRQGTSYIVLRKRPFIDANITTEYLKLNAFKENTSQQSRINHVQLVQLSILCSLKRKFKG